MRVTPTALPDVLLYRACSLRRRARLFLRDLAQGALRGARLARGFRAGQRVALAARDLAGPASAVAVRAGQARASVGGRGVRRRGRRARRLAARSAVGSSERLSGENHKQLYVPPGFAHGFCVLSESALLAYKCTELLPPGDGDQHRLERSRSSGSTGQLRDPVLSKKDAAGAAALGDPARALAALQY